MLSCTWCRWDFAAPEDILALEFQWEMSIPIARLLLPLKACLTEHSLSSSSTLLPHLEKATEMRKSF